YLELRQKLKEEIRKKQLGSDSRVKKSKLPYDNFGSFFGPSEPVIPQRVIEESKSLVENPHLVEKVLKAKSINQGGSSNLAVSKPLPNTNGHSRKVDIRRKPKAKVEMIKNTRDYSFILSNDVELLVASKNPPKSAHPQRRGHKDDQTIVAEKLLIGAKRGILHIHLVKCNQKLVNRVKDLIIPVRSPPIIYKKPLESRKDMDHKRDMDYRRDVEHGRDMEHKRDIDDRGSVKANMNRKPMVSSKPQIKQHSPRPPVSAQQKQQP
ncbi:hypothetical protein Tco_1220446, partial [Tanacetum coccineum]